MAVQAARANLRDTPNTEVRRLWLPDEWPDEAFDLIVVSEVAYYSSKPQLDHLIRCALRSLTPNGSMAPYHWRHHTAGCGMRADEVHETLRQGLTMARLGSHVEEDFHQGINPPTRTVTKPAGNTAKAASSLTSSPAIKAVEAPQLPMISSKAWPLSGADVGTMFTTF